jgi:hypothetical protein
MELSKGTIYLDAPGDFKLVKDDTCTSINSFCTHAVFISLASQPLCLNWCCHKTCAEDDEETPQVRSTGRCAGGDVEGAY